jgi:hypothetical protein
VRKGVSEVDLHNALAAFSREVAVAWVAREPPRSFISAWSFFGPIR